MKNFTERDSEVCIRQVARKRSGGRRPKPIEFATLEQDSDIEEIADPKGDEENPAEASNKRKGKAKATEVEEKESKESQAEQKRGKKRKTPVDEEGDSIEIAEQPKQKRGARAGQLRGTDTTRTNRARSKPASRAGSRQPSTRLGTMDHEKDEDEDSAVTKKKRKINIFPVTDMSTAPQLPSVRLSLFASLKPFVINYFIVWSQFFGHSIILVTSQGR